MNKISKLLHIIWNNRVFWICIFVAFFCVFRFFFYQPEHEHPYGILVNDNPIQTELSSRESFSYKEFIIQPVARFAVRARVLSTQSYRSGLEGDLSPIDFALGWKEMSDTVNLERIRIRQSWRAYSWRYSMQNKPMIDDATIAQHSANMHMVPADKYIRKALKSVVKGDVIEIRGKLINIHHKTENWFWTTSTSRNDTGNGACEIVYVEDIRILTDSVSE